MLSSAFFLKKKAPFAEPQEARELWNRSSRVACTLALLVPFGSILTAAAVPQATSVREADAACARCHSDVVRNYLSTPMANASGLASEKLIPGEFSHKTSDVDYSIRTIGGKPTLTIRSTPSSSSQETWPLTYFLGSGHLGVTYLYFVRDYLFESPVAWYASSGKYDMKPGFAGVPRKPPAIPMQSACLRCHMSGVQPTITGTINRYQGLPFLSGGITCESCHGASSAHVRSGGKAAIVNPAQLTAEQRDSVCIGCHLEGDVTVDRAGQSALNLRPGQSISTYLAYYVRGGSSLTARGVSEVEQLSQSVCKRTSGDRMSCTNCHDPHFTPAPEQRATFYRKKCLACHAQEGFAASHHPENPDCTGCHMPRTGAENIPHVAWTDHRILRVPELPNPEPANAATPAKPSTDLRPVFSPGATERDLAMAEYKLLLDGDRQFAAPALTQLLQVKGAISNDSAALDALGSLSAGRGDFAEAENDFRRVLAMDPSDLTALSNLGVLLAKQGKTPEAVQLLRRAFDRNQDLPGLALNLARTECLAGDSASARKTLEEALVFSPRLEDLEHLLDQMKDCRASSGGQ
jgi:predicted CXXCH cytochrome family protein